MARLEELTVGVVVRGLSPHGTATVVAVKWYGSDMLEVTYKDGTGRVEQEILYRDREPTLEVLAGGVPGVSTATGAVSARLRGPSDSARSPLRSVPRRTYVADRAAAPPDHCRLRAKCFLASRSAFSGRRPGRRQNHHGGAADQGTDDPRRPAPLSHRLPGQSRRPVAGRTLPPVPSPFRDLDQRQDRGGPDGELFAETTSSYRPAGQAEPQTRTCRRSSAPDGLGSDRRGRGPQDVRLLFRRARSSTPSGTDWASCCRKSRAISC